MLEKTVWNPARDFLREGGVESHHVLSGQSKGAFKWEKREEGDACCTHSADLYRKKCIKALTLCFESKFAAAFNFKLDFRNRRRKKKKESRKFFQTARWLASCSTNLRGGESAIQDFRVFFTRDLSLRVMCLSLGYQEQRQQQQ